MIDSSDKNCIVLFDHFTDRWLAFAKPIDIFAAHSHEEILPALEKVEQAVEKGNWAGGFVTYEAAPAFDSSLVVRQDESGMPLLWFGIYNQPQIISPPKKVEEQTELHWQPSIDVERYHRGFSEIKAHIEKGDTYQVNYTFRLKAPFRGDSSALFSRAVHAQGSGYPVYVELEEWCIASASPELFFILDGGKLISKPMKGTAPRGMMQADDAALSEWLHHSEKNRAENVMIVDMVRNDMGRIARLSSVRVPKLFDVEKYRTVWQMTSTVACETNASISEIFKALYPAASITGAPKARTMQIIKAIETTPRRIYTGTLGYIAPGRRAQFNVAIRTVLVDKRNSTVEYGLGGGIVWDSEQSDEFEEAFTKASILTQTLPQFSLLETMVWSADGGYALLDRHLQRMEESAWYFDFPFDEQEIREKLAVLALNFPNDEGQKQRIRLCLGKMGDITLENALLNPLPALYRVRLANQPISGRTPYLFHKTTYRNMYKEPPGDGFEDILLWNENGEVTESSIANLVVVKDGEWLTPPVQCGSLPGTARAQWLADGKLKEAVIRVEELAECEQIYLLNSVRGLWKVEFQMVNEE